MDITDKATPPVRGEIELFYRFEDGSERTILKKKNTIVNTAADIMARALAGNIYANGMYMAYTNGSRDTEPTPSKTRTSAYYRTTGSNSEKGFVRVPTLAQPEFAATESKYNSNKVTFVAISNDQVAIDVSGTNGVIDGTSAFYDATLAFLDPADLTKDILFSAITFADLGGASHFEKIAGADIGIRWNIYFEVS